VSSVTTINTIFQALKQIYLLQQCQSRKATTSQLLFYNLNKQAEGQCE